MTISKQYFRDHLVLLLLSVNVFLAVAGTLFILVRLGTTHGNGFIVQYRPSLAINIYTSGTIWEILSFVAFAWLVLAVHAMLSHRVYRIHRQLAIAILSLGILLLLLTIIVANSLLLLR